jgi:hypothetical protein
MNDKTILRSCHRAESVYFGRFCIRSRSRVSRAMCCCCIRDQEMLADACQGKLVDEA